MTNRLSAAKFARAQESWAQFMQGKVAAQIEEREAFLQNEEGWRAEELAEDQELLDLYDDEMFWTRYEKHMTRQREFIRRRNGVEQ